MGSFVTRAVPPFRLDLTVWALRRIAINTVDRWDGTAWRRTIVLRGRPVEMAVEQTGSRDSPELRVTLAGAHTMDDELETAALLDKMLGLHFNPVGFHVLAAGFKRLRTMEDRFRGLRPPRMPSAYEALINAYCCQQISLSVGIMLLNRLAARYGLAAEGGHAFPRPEDISGATVEELRGMGFSLHKAEYILDAACAVKSGDLDLEALATLDDAAAMERLRAIRGVGRWTAEYVLLRGLGRLNIFPGDDVGGQARLERWLGLKARPDYEGVRKLLDRWSPYRGLLYFYLLLDSLAQKGLVQE